MWLATCFGFFSVVCAQTPKGVASKKLMMVRARNREHLEHLRKFFPELPAIVGTAHTDYPYRIIAKRQDVYRLIDKLAQDINYTNFKAAAHGELPLDCAYHTFLRTTWEKGLQMQLGATQHSDT